MIHKPNKTNRLSEMGTNWIRPRKSTKLVVGSALEFFGSDNNQTNQHFSPILIVIRVANRCVSELAVGDSRQR